MEKSRGSSFSQNEDELLCQVYLEISQDPIGSNNQSLGKLWEKIQKKYNENKIASWEIRSDRSLQGRMNTIIYAVRNLKSCIIQVENMHLSGISEANVMEKAKKLFVQDPKVKKGFKFDHVWELMKDIPKFTGNVNNGIPYTPSTMSDTNESPTPESPRLSSFSINLSSDDGGSNSSQRPIGSKKAKLKRKISEGNNSYVETLVSSNDQILNFLKESAATREKGYEIAMQNQAKKLALKEMREENKILTTNLDTIFDINTRKYLLSEQLRIVQKRTQAQQQTPTAPSSYGQYFENLGGSGSNLPEY